MSLLDIDERILELIELVDFDKSPVDDIKEFTGQCLVGLIEGGCANEENVKVLRDFRKNCDVSNNSASIEYTIWWFAVN